MTAELNADQWRIHNGIFGGCRYGLSKTGRIITFAGVIMAVAFLGLLPSHEGNLQQISFIISVAVLCDTFLVRGLMIPCMMSILGKWNWWPRRM